MLSERELKFFPELAHLPKEVRLQRLGDAKKRAFGPDKKLSRWRGNILQFALMFAFSAAFMTSLAPMLSLSQETAALIMLIVVLPAFFILQQRRYIRLIRQALLAHKNID